MATVLYIFYLQSCLLSCEFFILLYFLTVWEIRRVRAANRGVRYTGEILLRHVGTWLFRGCRCAQAVSVCVCLWRPWSTSRTSSTRCVSAGPCTLSFSCDIRGRTPDVNTFNRCTAWSLMCQLTVPLSLFQLVLLGHQQFSKWYVLKKKFANTIIYWFCF